MSQFPILELPAELIESVLDENVIDPPTLLSFSLTSRQFSKTRVSSRLPEICEPKENHRNGFATYHIGVYLLSSTIRRRYFNLFSLFVDIYRFRSVFRSVDLNQVCCLLL